MQLAHRRLSIIDLSAAADQPFVKDGLHLSYNGELYNYRELRHELDGRRASDSRTQLRHRGRPGGLAALGTRRSPALPRDVRVRALRRAHRPLTLVRDPLGIKPLYVDAARRAASCSPPSSRRWSRPSGRSSASTRVRSSRRLLYYWLPGGRLRRHAASSSFRRDRGPSGAPTAPSARARYWDPRRGGRRPPRAGRRRTCATIVEESVAAHLVADVPVAVVPQRRARLQPHHRDGRAAATRRSRPTRSRSGPRTSVSRRCPTTLSTPARWPRTSASSCTRSRSARTSSTCSRAWWTSSTSRSATRPRSTPCSCARPPGTPGSRCCCPAWAPTSCSVATASTSPACSAAGTRRCPRSLRTGVVAPSVDRLPVAAGGRGLRYSRWAKRFLTFAELPEEAAFRRSYTLYDPAELAALLDPDLAPPRRRRARGAHRSLYDDNAADRPRQPDVPDRRAPVPAGTQPRLHRPLEHGRVDRGTGPVRRPVGLPGGVQLPGSREDQRPGAEGPARAGGARSGSRSEIVDRPKASFGAPLRAWVTQRPARPRSMTCCSTANWYRPGFCAASRCSDLVDRPTQRSAGPVQADLAAALDGALVPRRSGCRRRRGMSGTRRTRGKTTLKQVAQNYKSGDLAVLDVPVPAPASRAASWFARSTR